MCTLIALHRPVPDGGLVVAANRDEFTARPAEGPALRSTPSGGIVAPLDLEAGGTWLGLNQEGLFAALTNVSHADPDPGRVSRGRLVMDVLAARTVEEAADRLMDLPTGAYNPFNLLVADPERVATFTYLERPRPAAAGSGVFVVGNSPIDEPDPPKLAGLRQDVQRLAEGPADAVLEGLAELCRSHRSGPRGLLDAACVHAGAYGTRSSCLLRLGPAGLGDPASVLRHAEGPPCQCEYQDLTHLLRELDGQASSRAGGPVKEAS